MSMFKSRRIFTMIVFFVVLLLVPPLFKGSYLIEFMSMTAIWIVFSSSLRLLTSLGLVSFSHAAFLAIGAYTSALLTMRLGIPYWATLVMSGVIPGFFGLLLGYPMLRIKGHYFFLASFALSQVIILAISTQWRSVLGGTMGIANIPYPSVFSSPETYYYLTLGAAILTIAVVYRLDHCRIGLEMRAVREVDDLSDLLGIDTFKAKMVAFVAACFFAGIAGSLYAHFMRFISPDSFGFQMMLLCLTCVIVGGMYSTWGPVIGVVVLRFIVLAAGGLRQWEALINGAVLIIFITALPEGLTSLPQRIRGIVGWIRGKKGEFGAVKKAP